METIQLARGKGAAIVDDEDFGWAKGYRWYLKNGYACRYVPVTKWGRGDESESYLHAEVWERQHGPAEHVHHVNENTLDNRRENLKGVTAKAHRAIHRTHWMSAKLDDGPRQRKRAGSAYKGVAWHKRAQRWQVMFMVNGANLFLGNYDDPEEAALVYDAAVLHYREGRGYTNLIVVQ